VQRTQTQIKTNKEETLIEKKLNLLADKNIHLNNTDIKKILAYSAIKIIAKPTEPYSILNPDTNSDSPSEKSKGVRLVSATQQINQISANGVKRKIFRLNEFKIKKTPTLNTSLGIKKKATPKQKKFHKKLFEQSPVGSQ